jgi:single-strand DNA-binding protein
MSQENQITLRGYLTAEPKLYQKTPQAVPVTELRVGCSPRRLNHETGEWQELPTSYYRVKCWRRLAINAVSSLHKGDRVLIRGRFYMNTWVDSQQRQRSSLEVEADTLGHDLAYGWSHYLRGTRPSGDGAAVNSGEVARQETEAPVPDEPDGEFPPDPEANGPDEQGQGAGDHDGYPGDVGDAQARSREDGDYQVEDVLDAPGGTSAAGSQESDPDSLVREAVPY